MDKKTKIAFGVLFGSILLASFVYALSLDAQRQVMTCSDSDGGLILNVTGTASGITLRGENYSLTDYCFNNLTLKEYSCLTNGSSTFVQQWSHDCNCVNGRCV